MENSAQQVRNLDGVFEIDADTEVPPEPVLLVDDLVDSRWTLTLVAQLLRQAGSGPVFPIALADAQHAELCRLFDSPVPAQTIDGFEGEMATSPTLITASLSNSVVHDVPPLTDFKIPPPAIAA